MNSFSSLRVQGELKYTSNQHPTPNAAILGLLRLVAGNTNLALDFSSFWKIQEFQLGDDLTSYGIFGDEDSRNVIYLVCSGKVRLLGFDATLGREVSTQLLASEQIFGADDFFIHQSLQYRAFASSAGLIACITLNDLKPWFSEIPNLKDYLQQTTYERQTLIFLKTHTEFRSQTSLKLQKLLPNFRQIKINAGSSLNDAIPPDQGRFWLASGKIRTLSDTQPPVVGQSWGYPMTLPTWIAESDFLLYHLPREYCQSASSAPQLANQRQVVQNTANHQSIEEHRAFKYGVRSRSCSSSPPAPPASPAPLQQPTTNVDSLHPRLSWGIEDLLNKAVHICLGKDSPPALFSDFPQASLPWSIASLWRRYPFIQQHSFSDCGAACLAMVSQYWGKRFSLNTLRNLAQIDKTGASLSGLAAAAETLGYDTLTVRASLSKLEWQTNPWIAHWQQIHYVVVWQIKGDRVIISDPAIGKRSLSRQEFTACRTEYAVLLHPTERFQAIESEKIYVTRYLQLFRDYRQLLSKIILTSLLLAIFGLVTPLFAQLFLDMMPFQSSVTLNVFVGSFLFFGIWRVAIAAFRQHLLDYFANQIDLTLIGNFIRHALKLPLDFFASRQVEDIISRVQENRKIQQFLTRHAVSAIINALFAFVYIGLMAFYNLPLTLLVWLVVLAIAILNLAANPLLNRVSREIANSAAAQNSSLVEAIAGITTVKSAAVETEISSRWQERFIEMLKVLFDSQFTVDQAIAAAKLAEAHTAIVALHDGYNTQVGGQRLMLCDEQKKKIAIARALVRKIRILILDEVTSSLDASQRRFQQNLARLNRTTFAIAHHLGVVRNADCILVLDRGILVEQGTHQELMAINGIYYHFSQQQVQR